MSILGPLIRLKKKLRVKPVDKTAAIAFERPREIILGGERVRLMQPRTARGWRLPPR